MTRCKIATERFLYSERQKELAGTDGEEAFKKGSLRKKPGLSLSYIVPSGEPRHGPGLSKRRYAAVTEPIERPNWMPKNRLLYGLKRFGTPGAAVVLEARIQEQGGLFPRKRFPKEANVSNGQRLLLKKPNGFAPTACQRPQQPLLNWWRV
jgi:hypothetical protein